MLKKIILCLWAVCLVQAAYLDRRDGGDGNEGQQTGGEGQQGQEGGQSGQKPKPFTPDDFKNGITYGKDRLKGLRKKLDDLASQVIKGDKSDQDWLDYMGAMANFMKDGHKMFMEFGFGTAIVFHKMFAGEHGFQKISRCTYLDAATKDEDFGEKEFLPDIETAMQKDLICFSNVLHDMTIMEIKVEEVHQLSENDVIDYAGDFLKDLFELQNDGALFGEAVVKTAATYNVHIKGLDKAFHKEFNKADLVRELLRALQTKN